MTAESSGVSLAGSSVRKQIVETYFDGFRRSDHDLILSLLTDDVIWDLPGYKHLQGKEAFDAEIEAPGSAGSPALTIDRLVEDGDTIVALGEGSGRLAGGDEFGFAFCTVLTFADESIGRVESYIVPLPPANPRLPNSERQAHRMVPS